MNEFPAGSPSARIAAAQQAVDDAQRQAHEAAAAHSNAVHIAQAELVRTQVELQR